MPNLASKYLSLICLTTCLVYQAWSQAVIDTMPNFEGQEFLFVGKKIYTSETISLTNKDFKKLSASFDDPSRLLMKYPGFSNDNDQANGIIYHGLPSHFNGWQLNGLEIVNPNHLSNAGTFSDQSSISAGGVNMFSGNVIDRFSFSTPFDANKNSPFIGGSANIHINVPKKSFVQVSLLGLETGIAFNKNNHHFFTNLRYSFTGLLADFGVDFGGEQIRFADAVIGYNYTSDKSTTAVIFSRGRSRNYHPQQDSVKFVKDYLDINYTSEISVFELSHSSKVGTSSSIYLGLAHSIKADENTINGVYPDRSEARNEFNFKHELICLHQKFQWKQNFVFGIKEMFNDRNINSFIGEYWSILPYIEKKFTIKENWSLDTKIEAYIQSKNFFNPYAKLSYKNGSNYISLIANKSVQQLALVSPFSGLAQCTNLAINYKKEWSKITLQFNLFAHLIDNIASARNNNYSLFNIYDNTQSTQQNGGRAASKGFDLLLDYHNDDLFWVNANYSLFNVTQNSKTSLEPKWVSTENNFKNIANVNIGKDWMISAKKLSISSSFHVRGGQYVFNPLPSYENTKDYSTPPLTQLNPYSRIDLRINITTAKYLISLDIQNVGNKINDAYLSYDTDGINTRGQLGLLPVLSYRRILN